MDFRLSDEQIEWRDLCHRFAVEVMRPVAANYDRSQEVPWDVIREARKWKLSGIDWIQKMATDSDGLNGIKGRQFPETAETVVRSSSGSRSLRSRVAHNRGQSVLARRVCPP